MPAGCVYFVSFSITGYPRDLDSIYFLLALRLECTRPIFDVGGRIFSERNDRWIFLYFHSRSTATFFSPHPPCPHSQDENPPRPFTPGPSPGELLLRLTTTSRSIQPRITRQNKIRSTRRYHRITVAPVWIFFHFYLFANRVSFSLFHINFSLYV